MTAAPPRAEVLALALAGPAVYVALGDLIQAIVEVYAEGADCPDGLLTATRAAAALWLDLAPLAAQPPPADAAPGPRGAAYLAQARALLGAS
jgi:hypothetical protein